MPLRTSLYRKPISLRWPGRSQRRRQVLSVNMISLPLADFRHVSHIGNDAHSDSFGDLSFLKNGHSLLLQSSQSEQNLFMSCSPPPKPPRLNLDEADGPESPAWTRARQSSSQRRKKCSSLPLLDSEEGETEGEGDELGYHRASVSPGVSPRGGHSYRHSPGQGSLSSGRDGDSTLTCPEDATQQDELNNSFSFFSLDLGPSILDDVLRVMERLHQ